MVLAGVLADPAAAPGLADPAGTVAAVVEEALSSLSPQPLDGDVGSPAG
jgi:hypothetical protein